MATYYCSAVVNNYLVEEKISACSEKQAWFFFCRKNGYKGRDFKALTINNNARYEQIKLEV